MTSGESRARLVEVTSPVDAAGLVLVLHGGGDRPGHPPTRSTQLSVLRMVPLARQIARAGDGRLAVHRLLNSSRGWDPSRTPVDDVVWALERLRREGDRDGHRPPVCLVGHSLGGRAALIAGQLDGVVGVVALNPWLHADDGRDLDLPGRRVLVVHGTADRIADPRRSTRVVADLERRGVDTELVEVPGAKHAMLAQGSVFTDAAARFAADVLLGEREC